MTRKQRIMTAFGLELLGTSCGALQTYPLHDQQSTTVLISQTEQNRIAVLGDRIQQVFGAEGTFDVQSDEEGGQIFLIVAKTGFASFQDDPPLSKTRTITLITEDGLTQDLKLIPKSIESQSILFKPALSTHEEPKETLLHHALKLLKALVKNEELEGYTKTSLDKQNPSSRPLPFNSLKATLITTYKGEKFEGKVYTLSNQGKERLLLKEQELVLPEDVALSLSKAVIHPNEKITLTVISRRGL